jgi:hypothetical protein
VSPSELALSRDDVGVLTDGKAGLDDYVGEAARHAVEVVSGTYVPSP